MVGVEWGSSQLAAIDLPLAVKKTSQIQLSKLPAYSILETAGEIGATFCTAVYIGFGDLTIYSQIATLPT